MSLYEVGGLAYCQLGSEKARLNVIFAFLNGWEILALLAIVLLLFGASRLPRLARGMGEGVREFKKASTEEEKLKKDQTKTEFI